MARIGPGTVAAGALAIFLVLVTAFTAGRLLVDAPPSAGETTTGCSRCAPAEADAAPATPSAPAAECENVENVGTPAIDGGPQPTLAFPTELPPRDRGLVIEVPVEAESRRSEPTIYKPRGRCAGQLRRRGDCLPPFKTPTGAV